LKLINSLTEHRIREGFIKEKQVFFVTEKGTRIIAALELAFGKIRAIYMLRYLFDEGEETYFFLINGDTVVELEITFEEDQKEKIEITGWTDVQQYQSVITGRDNILELMIALELSKEVLS
jgi:hypothetical protein